jgi:uncharacterized membrane protein/YHS domain-containing protein
MTQFFGHFHPLLVHLPIGLIILLALLEWLARYPRFAGANSSARFILLLAVPIAAFTAICGWFLAINSSYDQRLLQLHRWTGIGTAFACGIVALFYWLDWKRFYRFSLLLTVLVLVVASHFGGSLTHGSDYLVRFAPQPFQSLFGHTPKRQIKVTSVTDLQVFHDIMQPILQDKCVACHGSEKAEGGLRLDSYNALLKGSKAGPVLLTDKKEDSSLLKRLRLPLQHKEHMPPEGKPQPTPEEISLLQWWINSGASEKSKVGELRPFPKILASLQARFGITNSVVEKVKPLNEIQPLMTKLAEQLGIVMEPLSPHEPWIQGNASIAGKDFGDAELAQLAPLSSNLRWLDLAGTKVSDTGMAHVSAMSNLIRLHLERTALTDQGLARLATLPKLQYLNLYGTEITDRGLSALQSLPELKQLYLWQTKVTPAAAKAFAESLGDEEQLQRWREEIGTLTAKIKSVQVIVDVGTPVSTSTNSTAINTLCPVSGKAVDPTRSITYEGQLIAFCCDDCREQFRRDPKALMTKLASKTSNEPKPGEK